MIHKSWILNFRDGLNALNDFNDLNKNRFRYLEL
jgi:hypothetical protein